MDLPPPGGVYQGSGDRESQDIGPPETEYGRAIHCDATDSRTLRGGGAAGGGKQFPQHWWEQPRIDWKLAREQGERAVEAAGHAEVPADRTTTETPGSGKGTGEEASLGDSGSSGDEGSGAQD